MLSSRKPDRLAVQRFIDNQRALPFTYSAVGATRAEPPAGYVVDRNRTLLGHGEGAYQSAVAAIRRWEMFRIPGLELCWPEAPIEAGSTVAVLTRVFGFWWLNACRIVYVLDEEEPIRRFGFAYGTLPEHGESGEERFGVEWRSSDDSVWYDILAFSRPNHFLVSLGFPFARRIQKRFAADSLVAMKRAVAENA
jgi:uncharacterized protein (UPF0548 family)